MKKPTLAQVAEVAGVAMTTAGRVVRGEPNVRHEVRDRVWAAVETLGYKVDLQARLLATGGSRSIGIIYAAANFSEPNSYYHTGIELGALRACIEFGLQLTMHPVNQHARSVAGDVLKAIEGHQFGGVVLTPPFCDDVSLIDALAAAGVRVVGISPGPTGQRHTPGVGIDEELAAYELASHLIDLGHRRFGYVKGLAHRDAAEERFAGFQRAITRAGIAEEAVISVRGAFTFHSGAELAKSILSREDRPTALVCANDDMAAGALFTAHELGIRIPGEMSIVGFDNAPISEVIWPPLTTIAQPLRDMGHRAVAMLVEQMKHPTANAEPGLELLPHHLILRRSTGHAPQD